MRLTILALPGCPNVAALDDRLATVLNGRAEMSLSHQVIVDEREAARWGMRGSPTLLIDGTDPFAEAGQEPGLSCRRYRDDDGQLSGAPSVSQLRQAIEQALAVPASPNDRGWPDELGRGGAGRVAPAERGLRAVHQAVLRSFVSTGAPPGLAGLAQHAMPFDVAQVLAELADGDFVVLDDAGKIAAAYPFSARPTTHRVRLPGGATVFAMCAIDALGMSAMIGVPVEIESADPSTGQAVTVHVDGFRSTWDPATAVVFVGHAGGHCRAPSASLCCGYMNFFATRMAARTWAAAHSDISGGILDQDRALRMGIGIFGQLLS